MNDTRELPFAEQSKDIIKAKKTKRAAFTSKLPRQICLYILYLLQGQVVM